MKSWVNFRCNHSIINMLELVPEPNLSDFGVQNRSSWEILIFPYISFFVSLLAIREVFPLLLQCVFLLLLIISAWIQYRDYIVFSSTKALLFFIFILSIASFFIFNMDIIEFLGFILILFGFVKFFSPMTSRDIWQIYGICLVMLCISSIWNFSIFFGFLILIFCWNSIVGLCILSEYKRDPYLTQHKKIILFSTIKTSLVVIVGMIFFLFLPRTPYTIPIPFGISRSANVGFTDEVDMRGVESIKENSDIAFRTILTHKLSNPYWRGIVYDTYRNGKWIRTIEKNISSDFLKFGCKSIKQTIFLEPYDGNILFGLNFPFKLKIIKPAKIGFYYTIDGCINTYSQISFRIAYDVYSCNALFLLPYNDPKYLEVPDNLEEKLKEFLSINKINGKADEIVKSIKYIFNSSPFVYSNKIKMVENDIDPIVEFLFNTHRGWCEHFATAMALLLRCASIPTRVVGGYRGGIWNEMGNYYIVSQNNAHLWVEYFDENRWKMVDPTPSFNRIKEQKPSFVLRWMDYLRVKWYLYVISYDYSKQQRLFKFLKNRLLFSKFFASPKKVTFNSLNKLDKKIIMVILLLILLFIILFNIKRSPSKNLANSLREFLRKKGFDIKDSQGLFEIAENIKQKDEKLAILLIDFAKNWYYARFGFNEEKTGDAKKKFLEIKMYLKGKSQCT